MSGVRRRKGPSKRAVANSGVQTDDEDGGKVIVRKGDPSNSGDPDKVKLPRSVFHSDHNILVSRRVLFPLGLLLGVVCTYFLMPVIPPHLSLMLEEYDLTFPYLANMNMSFPALEFEWRQLTENIFEGAKKWTQNRDFSVGTQMKAEGLEAKHPVILVPGIVSTGLESWSTAPEYRSYFRKRLWGTTTMIRAVLAERERWMAAMLLDPETGLDPPGVKVRAAQGLDAASTFIPGYWIWSKVIENLACINYDTNNMELASYDWRLTYYNLEVRDGYFSKLKATIESFKKREGQKVVIVGHSMGSSVCILAIPLFKGCNSDMHIVSRWSMLKVMLYFLKWVEAPGYGGGGPNWVENHVESFVSIGGTFLGVAKAVPAFLSGEMKDTAEMNPAGAYVLERFFSRSDRAKLMRSWGGGASLWPKGGNTIWGDSNGAVDDKEGQKHTHGYMISFRAATSPATATSIPSGDKEASTATPQKSSPSAIPVDTDSAERSKHSEDDLDLTNSGPPDVPIPHVETSPGVGNLTMNDAEAWVWEHTPNSFQRMMYSNYSNGIERNEKQLKKNNLDHRKWSNPLEIQLPNAPSMKIYCLYGHGKETERSYWYARGEFEQDENSSDAMPAVCLNTTSCDNRGMSPRSPMDLPLSRQSWIDVAVNDASDNPVRNGVKIGEGDGTVPLISLGAMCVEGWKRKLYNPAGIEVKTYEMAHQPEGLDMRGGATTSDHIDILGSTALNEIVLKVAAGRGAEVEERFVSNIRDYVKRIPWDG